MTVRRPLTLEEREEIAVGREPGEGVREIARRLDRDPSVIGRELRRNSSTRGYRASTAHRRATERSRRPQQRRLERELILRERVLADLRYGRTPNQIAGRLKLEAADGTVAVMEGSLPAGGATISHEAVCTWFYALPKGELARLCVMLPGRRTRRGPRRRPDASKGARITGMRSIHDRPAEALGRQVPGRWEGDLIIGKEGRSAAATLVDRSTRFCVILALPEGKNTAGLSTVLTEQVPGMTELVRKSLTWDQGTEMGRHAALTLATGLDVCFADPYSPWQRPTNENTNGIIRRYLPKGTEITDHQPCLTAIAEEINNQPRRCLGYLTPQEAFQRALTEGVASTN
ncbi:IS30 family transposase [Streptomyces pratens]|uniref:IS30 family transposase n=1 Tax=Streptomyces pratens TaxID=887456 RepID=A0ABW1M5A3_9ACTN